MVFVPWAEQGICKYYMNKRCWDGDKCRWKHPEPGECKRLWDFHTHQQREAERRGVPPLQNPAARRYIALPPPPSEDPVGNPRRPEYPVSLRNFERGYESYRPPPSPLPPLQPERRRPLPMSEALRAATRPTQPVGDSPYPRAIEGAFEYHGPAQLQAEPKREPPISQGRSLGLEEVTNSTATLLEYLHGLKLGNQSDRPAEGDLVKSEPVGEFGPHNVPPPPPGSPPLASEVEWSRGRNSWDGIGDAAGQDPTSASSTYTLQPVITAPMPAMGATQLATSGMGGQIGPHPSNILVSAQYMSQAAIDKKFEQARAELDVQERSRAEAREDSIRLQGVQWIDLVRRGLELPLRTYTTACVFYHKFRLAQAGNLSGLEYGMGWIDLCAGSLLLACKIRDTLKKSREILAEAHNLKVSLQDRIGTDDPILDAQSKSVLGIERLVLEADGFDFRTMRDPHEFLAKCCKTLLVGEDGEKMKIYKLAATTLTDIYRTFAPVKQTSQTLALSCLELALHLAPEDVQIYMDKSREAIRTLEMEKWSTSREEQMETLLDALDMYTQHTSNTILGTSYTLEKWLSIRLAYNKECNESGIARYTTAAHWRTAPADGSSLRVSNGHPTPVSPMEPAQAQSQNANAAQGTGDQGGTQRFMLNPQRAAEERAQIQKYYTVEFEEVQEEVQVPVSRARSGSADRLPQPPRRTLASVTSNERLRDSTPRAGLSDRDDKDSTRKKDDRDRERERLRESQREVEIERARLREMERDRRYDDRPRFEGRERDWDRRDRRYDDRRYDDSRRRDDRR